MGLITGYENIGSKAYYHISLTILGQEFFYHEGIEDAKRALDITKELTTQGNAIEITRTLVWNNTKSGYRTKDPESKEISIVELEKIVKNGEDLPIYSEPTISSSYRCTSI